ncbi:MAG: iron-containing alcohol dehydrogenase [Spirochaetia bacterium]
MQDFHFTQFMSRFDEKGTLACACGQTHHRGTGTVLVSRGALEESGELVRRTRGSGCRLWVLSDENTEAAAGARWKAAVGTARVDARVLPGRPKPHPTMALVAQLAAEVRAASPDLLVSVGGGVISDLVKRLSLDLGLPNWCVATAPSVDAYSSGTSAVTVNGFHGTVPARASDVIVCDLDVMERAPRELHLAGLGDLLAKFLAFLDWNVSRIVTGESYCALAAEVALASARDALSAARGLGRDPGEAARTLTDAALSSGFAMQALGGSRSAATAEHTMAHFWESARAAGNTRWDLHGILTGVASRMMLHCYRALYARLPDFALDEMARLGRFDSEPPWRETVERALAPFMAKVEEEMAGRTFERGDLARRLESFRGGRTEISSVAAGMLDELAAAVETLEGIGFPFSLQEVGLRKQDVLLPFRNIRLLRRRYSTFDLASDLGLDEVMLMSGEGYAAAF